jgi:small subunit ribosomal protein S7
VIILVDEKPVEKPETVEEPKPVETPKPVQEKTAEPKPAKKELVVEKKVPVDSIAGEPIKTLVPKRIVGIPPDKLKLFDRYDLSDIVVSDAGLARYINLDPVIVPHTGARHANRPFAKSKMNIVERLVNNMMRNEDYTGKKTKTYRTVMLAFAIIESKTKKNPVQVFIDALENTTPREEVTRLKYGGVSVPKAVDISSSRRLDIALRNICKGAINGSYKNTKPIEICLANEIMAAAKGDMASFAVSKKEEVERVAGSAR